MYYPHLWILKAHFEDNQFEQTDKMGESFSSGMLSQLSVMKNLMAWMIVILKKPIERAEDIQCSAGEVIEEIMKISDNCHEDSFIIDDHLMDLAVQPSDSK